MGVGKIEANGGLRAAVGSPAAAAKTAPTPRTYSSTGIPLVFYGENGAEYGNPIADNATSLRDRSYYSASDIDNIYLGAPPSQNCATSTSYNSPTRPPICPPTTRNWNAPRSRCTISALPEVDAMHYIGMSKDEFLELCDQFRSPHLWMKENGEWKLRHPVYQDNGN
jgi:hypothetical protein